MTDEGDDFFSVSCLFEFFLVSSCPKLVGIQCIQYIDKYFDWQSKIKWDILDDFQRLCCCCRLLALAVAAHDFALGWGCWLPSKSHPHSSSRENEGLWILMPSTPFYLWAVVVVKYEPPPHYFVAGWVPRDDFYDLRCSTQILRFVLVKWKWSWEAAGGLPQQEKALQTMLKVLCMSQKDIFATIFFSVGFRVKTPAFES